MCGFIEIEKRPEKHFCLSERYSLPLRCYTLMILELLPYQPVAFVFEKFFYIQLKNIDFEFDNASFIANGIPSVAITMLPREEATALMRNVQRDKSFENALLNHSVVNTNLLPMTWRFMHTPFDAPESLTPESFVLMEKFLDSLAKQKTTVF